LCSPVLLWNLRFTCSAGILPAFFPVARKGKEPAGRRRY
jgi:hypothetical protein